MSDLEVVGRLPKPSNGQRKERYIAKVLDSSQAKTMEAIRAAIDGRVERPPKPKKSSKLTCHGGLSLNKSGDQAFIEGLAVSEWRVYINQISPYAGSYND